MNVLAWIVVGLVAGWLSGAALTDGEYGFGGHMVVGILGALFGGVLAAELFGVRNPALDLYLPTLAVAFLGSVVLIGFVRLLPGWPPRRHTATQSPRQH